MQLTNYEPADELAIGSGFRRAGAPDITNAEWCRREVARLRAKGVHAADIRNPKGEVAVFVADSEEALDAIRNREGIAP